MPDIDFERLSRFDYAIINLLGQDGFPWSLATQFRITAASKILLDKPVTQTSLVGKKVGVLFNHITAIPTGGYSERRYMLIWGRLAEQDGRLRLDPETFSEWDEKILPFPELCARAAPQGQKYLETLKSQVVA